MIDQNRDGFIDKDDLHDMLASLGKFIEEIERYRERFGQLSDVTDATVEEKHKFCERLLGKIYRRMARIPEEVADK